MLLPAQQDKCISVIKYVVEKPITNRVILKDFPPVSLAVLNSHKSSGLQLKVAGPVVYTVAL